MQHKGMKLIVRSRNLGKTVYMMRLVSAAGVLLRGGEVWVLSASTTVLQKFWGAKLVSFGSRKVLEYIVN